MTAYVQEFLYRGRCMANEPDLQPAYHVVLGEFATVLGETKCHLSAPMTPAQAEAAGFALPAILADINQQTLAALEAANAQVAQLQQEAAESAAQLQQAADAHAAQLQALTAQLAALQAQLDALTAPAEGQPQ